MALTAQEVFVAGGGHVYVADLGTTEPTDTVAAWPAGWEELGYVTDAGVTITPGKTITDIGAWQSRLPVRRIVTAETFDVAFTLTQWNADTIALAFGGGAWVGDVYTPPAAGDIDERMLGVEANDGEKTLRLVVPRGMVTNVGGMQFISTDANPIPITFSALETEGEAGFTIIADWVAAS